MGEIIFVSGPQKGPAERGHVKKRQKPSKSVKNIFDTFRQFSRKRQKVSKIFSTLFGNFRAAPVFRPLLGGSDLRVITYLFADLSLIRIEFISEICNLCQGPLNGGVSNGGGVSRSGLVLPFLSFLGLSRFFRDFPDLLGDSPEIFPICPFPSFSAY